MPLRALYHRPGQEEKESPCCSLALLKLLQYLHLFLLLLLSIFLLSIGFLLLFSPPPLPPLLPPGLLSCLAGLLLLTTCCIGSWATQGERRRGLIIYTVLLVTAIIMQLGLGVTAYLCRSWVHQKVVIGLNRIITEDYSEANSSGITLGFDQLQASLQCCGAESFMDWRDSFWAHRGDNGDSKVPSSCCKSPSPGCGVRDHPSNIYYTGCGHRLSQGLKEKLLLVACLTGSLMVVQVGGLFLVTRLRRRLSEMGEE